MGSNYYLEVLKIIKLVGYNGILLSENELKAALQEGSKSIEYTKLVNFLTNELRELCNLDECVNTIATPDDSNTFLMEITSFLNELGCPHARLTQGHVSDRLSTVEDRTLLIQHLSSELIAARIIRENQPEKRMDLKLRESEQASDLRKILQILGYPQPPRNITMQGLLQKLTPSIQKLVTKAHKDLVGKPIFNGCLTEAQWEVLEKVDRDLHDEYLIRREMLLTRLDCTIQSFQWSDKTKGKDNVLQQKFTEKRKLLNVEPQVDISDLLASRDDLAIIEKTSSASVRKNTKSSIKDIVIGAVPDRGGRTSEQAPPPPEMPPWQQRNAGPTGGGGGGFRGGSNRGRSNFSRGGAGGNTYSQGGNSNYSDSGFNRGSSNYSRGGGRGNSYSSQESSSYDSGFNKGGNSYSQGANSNYSDSGFNRGSSNYSRGSGRGSGNSYSSQESSSYDSGSNKGGNSYSQGNYGSYSDARSGGINAFDSAGSYGKGGDFSQSSDYSRGGTTNYARGSDAYSQESSSRAKYSESRGGSGSFDSAGSYGRYSQDYQEPKRAKTYDQFLQNKSSYADQYVEESQHNMQYQSRDRDNRSGRSGGGRSNYNRGGGSYH